MRAMVDAAIELFAAVGYDGASTRVVAERAGCSETLLFRYFGGKRGLLLAICNRLTERDVERLRAEDFSNLEEYLEKTLLNTLANIRRDGAAIRVIAGAIVTDDELAAEFEQRHDEAVEYLTEQLAHFQRAGTIGADVDIASVAAAMEQAGFALGLLVQVVYGKPQSELEAVVRTLAAVLSAGMRGERAAVGSPVWREAAVQAAREASDDIGRLLSLLGSVK